MASEARITQVVAEVLAESSANPLARVTQVVIEVLRPSVAPAEIVCDFLKKGKSRSTWKRVPKGRKNEKKGERLCGVKKCTKIEANTQIRKGSQSGGSYASC